MTAPATDPGADEEITEAPDEHGEIGRNYVEPTKPGTLRWVIDRWYADAAGYDQEQHPAPAVRYDLNARLVAEGFNPWVLEHRALELAHTLAGDSQVPQLDHGNPEVRAIAGCIELLAVCSPHGRHRVLAYLKAFTSDEQAGGSPLQVVPPRGSWRPLHEGPPDPDDEAF